MTDVELDERVTALEENGGGFVNGKKFCQKHMVFLTTWKDSVTF